MRRFEGAGDQFQRVLTFWFLEKYTQGRIAAPQSEKSRYNETMVSELFCTCAFRGA